MASAITVTTTPTLWTITRGAFTYHVSSQQAWNLGEVTYADPVSGRSVQIIQDQLGAGNGLAWKDNASLSYHGTIHGGESDVTLTADLDGVTITQADTDTFTGDVLTITRTSNLFSQYWTWTWSPTRTGWAETFVQRQDEVVSPFLYFGYTSMLIFSWGFVEATINDDATIHVLDHESTGNVEEYLDNLQTLHLYDRDNAIRCSVEWGEPYAVGSTGHFLQMRPTSKIVKYYPTRPYLRAPETRTYTRTVRVASMNAVDGYGSGPTRVVGTGGSSSVGIGRVGR